MSEALHAPLPDGECHGWLRGGERVNAFPYPRNTDPSDREYWNARGYKAEPLYTADQMRAYADATCSLRGGQQGVDVDALAQHIRRVDGKNDMGAGALAESIVAWLAASPSTHPQETQP